VVFPAYSRLHDDDARKFPRAFSRLRWPLVFLGGTSVAALIACAPSLVALLYPKDYLDAGWILQFLAIAAWFQILECTNGAAILAAGEAAWVAAGNAAKVMGMLALIPLGFYLDHANPFRGAVAGLVASELLKYAVSAWAIRRRRVTVFLKDLVLSVFVLATAAFGIAVERALHRVSGSNLLAVAGSAAVVCLIWSPLAYKGYRVAMDKGRGPAPAP
jgi:O-antigen/teichoic acid export membrane protein